MRTGFKIAVVVGLASLVLAGVALAGWGGGGYRRGAGPGPGLEGQAPADQQNQAPWMGRGPWGAASGPQVGPRGQGWGAGPEINNPPAVGGNYGFCPYCGAPCPRSGWAAPGAGLEYGPAAGRGSRFGRGGGPGPGFQGGPMGPQGQGFGFGRGNMMRQPGPMADNWRRGSWQARRGEDFPPSNRTPQSRAERPRWRQGGDEGRSGPDTLMPPVPPLDEDEDDFWAPPRWQHWGPGRGLDLYPGDELDIDVPGGPEVTAPRERPADEPIETPEENVPGPEIPQP